MLEEGMVVLSQREQKRSCILNCDRDAGSYHQTGVRLIDYISK